MLPVDTRAAGVDRVRGLQGSTGPALVSAPGARLCQAVCGRLPLQVHCRPALRVTCHHFCHLGWARPASVQREEGRTQPRRSRGGHLLPRKAPAGSRPRLASPPGLCTAAQVVGGTAWPRLPACISTPALPTAWPWGAVLTFPDPRPLPRFPSGTVSGVPPLGKVPPPPPVPPVPPYTRCRRDDSHQTGTVYPKSPQGAQVVGLQPGGTCNV